MSLAAALAAAPAATPALQTKPAYYGALGGIFLALVILLLVAFGVLRRDGRTVKIRRRLSLYTLTGRPTEHKEETASFGDSAVAHSAIELAGRVIQRRDLEAQLARKLESAGLPIRPAEWLVIHLGIGFGLGLVLLLATGGKLIAGLIGLIIGLLGPAFYLSVKETRRTSEFLTLLPDTLQLIAGSLAVGYALPQAIDAVVRQGAEPVAGEFNKALVEARLGLPVEDALDGVAARMRSRDFSWVVMAIRIQRQVGGNLAEVLNNAANTLRERDYLRRQVRVLSAEGRLSAIILYALPFVFSAYLLIVRPTYIHSLYTDPIGIVLIFIGAGLLILGGFWLRAVIRVEV